MSPSAQAIYDLLVKHGPLWVNGKNHITVIAGIRDTGGTPELLIYDPAMPAKTGGEWRKLTEWYTQDGHSGRDTSAAVQAVFLRLPAR